MTEFNPTPDHVKEVIVLARKHVSNGAIQETSARFCLADAVARYDEGEYLSAYRWAVRSLQYSVGIFHPDYKKVNA